MKKFRVLIMAFISMPFLLVQANESKTQDTDSNSYSIYLVRHAEKQMDIGLLRKLRMILI